MKKYFISAFAVILSVSVLYSLSTKDDCNSFSFFKNAEALIDGEAIHLNDCNIKGDFNSYIYVYTCDKLTTDYFVYPCITFDMATSNKGKCKLD